MATSHTPEAGLLLEDEHEKILWRGRKVTNTSRKETGLVTNEAVSQSERSKQVGRHLAWQKVQVSNT